MPRIQQYTSQIRGGVPNSPKADAAAFGSDTRGLNALQQLTDDIGDIVQKREEVEYHRQISEFRLQSMERAQELNTTDGDLTEIYESDFQKRVKELQIPRSMRDRAAVDLDNMRVSYVGGAIQEQARRVAIRQKENWEAMETANINAVFMNPDLAESVLAEMKEASGGLSLDSTARGALLNDTEQKIRGAAAKAIVSSDPQRFIDEAKEGKYNDLAGLPSLLTRARGTLKAGARSILRPRIDDALAEATATGDSSIMPSRGELIQAYDETDADRMLSQFEDAKAFGEKWQQVAVLPPDELGALVNGAAPQGEGFAQEQKQQQALIQAVQARQKQLNENPVGYVRGNFAEVDEAFKIYEQTESPSDFEAAMDIAVEKQGYLGVPTHKQRMLSDSVAKDLVAQLDGVKPQERLQQAASMKQQYGKYWPDVYREMVKGGMSDITAVMLRMDSPLQGHAVAMLAEADAAGIETLQKTLGEDAKVITDRVAGNLGDFFATVSVQPGNTGEFERTLNASRALAYQYSLGGMKPSAAADKATDDIVGLKYDFTGSVRVPKQFDIDLVEAGMDGAFNLVRNNDRIIPDITGSLLDTPDDIIEEQYREELSTSGYFVTNPNEDGVYMFDRKGRTVMTDTGPLEIKFSDLERMGATETKTRIKSKREGF